MQCKQWIRQALVSATGWFVASLIYFKEFLDAGDRYMRNDRVQVLMIRASKNCTEPAMCFVGDGVFCLQIPARLKYSCCAVQYHHRRGETAMLNMRSNHCNSQCKSLLQRSGELLLSGPAIRMGSSHQAGLHKMALDINASKNPNDDDAIKSG